MDVSRSSSGTASSSLEAGTGRDRFAQGRLSSVSLEGAAGASSTTATATAGSDQTVYEVAYEEKRIRLAALEAEARELREDVARHDEEIQLLRNELGLTKLAQFKQVVGNSAAVQKTKEFGGRVTQTEVFKKTQSTLSGVGTKTSELLKTAGTKTQEVFTSKSEPPLVATTSSSGEAESSGTGWGQRLRQASVRLKERVASRTSSAASIETDLSADGDDSS